MGSGLMGKRKEKISSSIAWSTPPDKISVRGLDLPNEILGHMNLGDLAFLQLTGRKATPEESRVFNAIVITLVEHGITPSALAARMTYMGGAPESLQAAVAAGLCGLGTVFVGSMEGASKCFTRHCHRTSWAPVSIWMRWPSRR